MLFWAVAEKQQFMLGSSEKSFILLVTYLDIDGTVNTSCPKKGVPCVNLKTREVLNLHEKQRYFSESSDTLIFF